MFYYIFKHNFIMKINIHQIIYFCLINYVGTFPNDLFDELWQTNQSKPQANNNPIESQPKIKVEPHEEQFDGRWRDESALKGIVKVEHEPHYGAVKLEGEPLHKRENFPKINSIIVANHLFTITHSWTDKIKHEFEWWGEESDEFKEQTENRVKKEDQDGQPANISDHKKIGDNSNKDLSDQNNSTDQDENADKQNDFNKCEKIESDQQKREIIQKFREMKEDYKKKRKYSKNEWVQIETKISNSLSVGRTILYKWIKELGLNKEKNFKSKFSDLEKREILKQFEKIKSKCKKAKLKNISINELDDKITKKMGVSKATIIRWKRKFGLSFSKKISDLEKREILKQFDEIKSKCQKAKLKNNSKHELDEKIAKKFGVCRGTITEWKRKFGLSFRKKISDATKIGILKKYAKIKRNNPKMSDCAIADLLEISICSLNRWKAQFSDKNNHL